MPTSHVFKKRPEAPAPDVLAEVAGAEVAWLSDALGFGLMDNGIRAIWPVQERIVGPALTVRTAPGDFQLIPWAIDLAEEGDVLVIDTGGVTQRAVWGDYFSGWARAKGIRAVVIDGATRDRGAIEKLGYPVFARGTTSRQPTLDGPGEVNVPVTCGGLTVLPGDLIVGDGEGVAVVPRRSLDAALAAIRGKVESEKQLPAPSAEAWPGFFGFFAGRAEPVMHDAEWHDAQ